MAKAEYSGFGKEIVQRMTIWDLSVGDQFSLLQDLTGELLLHNKLLKPEVRQAVRDFLAAALDETV